jgi:flagellar basal body-associated protein FliL
MADSGNAAVARNGTRSFLGWKVIALAGVLLAVVVGGGAGYLYFFQPKVAVRAGAEPDAPAPVYLELKPFVVSLMMSGDDATHFVQLGATLTLSGAPAGKIVEAYLPEVEDTMRQTVLGFKIGDVTTAAGVDKLRAAMTANVNRLLLQRLGAARIERENSGEKNLVRNVFFSTLVVE